MVRIRDCTILVVLFTTYFNCDINTYMAVVHQKLYTFGLLFNFVFFGATLGSAQGLVLTVLRDHSKGACLVGRGWNLNWSWLLATQYPVLFLWSHILNFIVVSISWLWKVGEGTSGLGPFRPEELAKALLVLPGTGCMYTLYICHIVWALTVFLLG